MTRVAAMFAATLLCAEQKPVYVIECPEKQAIRDFAVKEAAKRGFPLLLTDRGRDGRTRVRRQRKTKRGEKVWRRAGPRLY